MFNRLFQRAVGIVAEGLLTWLGFSLAFLAVAAGVLWMILWGWSLVFGHGTVRGHTDFGIVMLAVSFFHWIEKRRTRPIRGIKRRLLFHGVEIAVVGGLLMVGPWLNGKEVSLPISVIWAAAICYVSIIVAVKDFCWWLESKGERLSTRG
ncbi:hypothetical protein [Polycladomyces subterraneus]|uniref:Transmembrane protein n=1 Tax=Polycladomyces subterraneus TaxID=1016997 RepID=A0ABT8IR52_9BACL|nr:hypothetical protein [Polycladomyces subterraneus]MDN4595198.1 hypothetical protein [Polycladomyces subterraneus]